MASLPHANLTSLIQTLIPVAAEELSAGLAFFQPRFLKKGDFLVEQGQVCRYVAYVQSGMLRSFYPRENGEDVTSCFCVSNGLTTSYQSFLLQEPSTLSLEALEPSSLLVIEYQDLQRLYQQGGVWLTLGKLIAEREYLTMASYAVVLNTETAEEKYQRLLREQPDIVLRAPVQHIASYLGVTRRTLSRIRRGLRD